MSFKKQVMIVATVALLLAAAGVQARSDHERSETYADIETVKISTVSGDCQVVASTTGKVEVRVAWRIDPEDAFEPKIRQRGGTLRLSERFYGSSRGSSEWTVAVPENVLIRFETASGDLAVEGLKTSVRAETASGEIHLMDCSGEFDINTASGDIDTENCHGVFIFNTASGRVDMDDCGGEFELNTASGDIDVDNLVMNQPCDFSAASGDVRVTLGKTPDHDLSLSTASGRAILNFNGHPIRGHFEFVAKYRSGDIDSPIAFEDEDKFRRHGDRYVRKWFTKETKDPEIYIGTASGRAILRES